LGLFVSEPTTVAQKLGTFIGKKLALRLLSKAGSL
jgi:RNA processing factor Prp31